MRSSCSRHVLWGLALSCLFSLGCTDHFLRKHTARTASTLTDIMFQQVMDNVAMFCCEPDTLPHFAILGDGTTQLQDSAQATVTPKWKNPLEFVDLTLGMNGQHQLMENWKLQPVMSAGRLKRMRAAFRYVVNPREFEITHDGKSFVIADDSCAPFLSEMIKMQLLPTPSTLQKADNPCALTCKLTEVKADGIYFQEYEDAVDYLCKLNQSLMCNFPTDWFSCGPRRQAPLGCTWVGRYCSQRAWIDECATDDLARFTTTVLLLAAQDPKPEAEVAFVKRIGASTDKEGYQITWSLPVSKVCLTIPPSMDPCGQTTEKQTASKQLIESLKTLEKRDSKNFKIWKDKGVSLTSEDFDGLKKLIEQEKMTNLVDDMEFQNATDEALEAIKTLQAPNPIFVEIEPTSPFDRPGNSPFSKGGGGAEFAPTLNP